MSILWNPSEATSITTVPMPIITTGTQNMGNGVYLLKAGTPLDEDFAVSNDGDAKYLVAEDFFFYSNTPTQPKLVPIITGGYIDLNKAQEAAGITYAEAAVAALKEVGIVLVDGLLDTGSGGSSGGGVELVQFRKTANKSTCDHTFDSLVELYQAGVLLLAYIRDKDGYETSVCFLNGGESGFSFIAIYATDYNIVSGFAMIDDSGVSINLTNIATISS